MAFHHGRLSAPDRIKVETMFRNGLLAAVASTSTLALGVWQYQCCKHSELTVQPRFPCRFLENYILQVNLPAHCVVLQNTKQYTPSGVKELTESQVLQMIGRAGRPGYDTKAVAIILTTTSQEDKYRNLVSGMKPLESGSVWPWRQKKNMRAHFKTDSSMILLFSAARLHRCLSEHINAEVTLKTINSGEL